MPKTCNIDARGRLVRLVWGLILVAGGLLLMLFWALPAGGWLAWLVTILTVISGVFAIYEARAGWCALRAMGFKTPM
jgi:phage shock protein PspC (stress-responsive transcriptional regulator)